MRVRLLSDPGTHCVKFTHANTSFYLMTEAGIEARRQVATNLTPDTARRLQTAPTSDSRDFSLMQELADAGFGRCPMSGVPTFDPSRCSAAKLDATWRVYCSIARSATDTSERIAQEATDALDALKQCLSADCDA